MGHIEGPQQKVIWQIYDDLSKKLGGVAKKYGLSKEWEHYNNLSSQFHKYYSKIADDIVDAKAVMERHWGDPEAVLNGVAALPGAGEFLLTGKNWRSMYHVRLAEDRAPKEPARLVAG